MGAFGGFGASPLLTVATKNVPVTPGDSPVFLGAAIGMRRTTLSACPTASHCITPTGTGARVPGPQHGQHMPTNQISSHTPPHVGPHMAQLLLSHSMNLP